MHYRCLRSLWNCAPGIGLRAVGGPVAKGAVVVAYVAAAIAALVLLAFFKALSELVAEEKREYEAYLKEARERGPQ
jgi:uncharacterized protein (DUF2062 family)